MRAMSKLPLVAALLVLVWACTVRADAPPKLQAMRETDNWTVDDKGDATFTAKLVFPNEKSYLSVQQNFPDPKVLLRDVVGPTSKLAAENIKVGFNSDDNALEMSGVVLGSAQTNKRGRWQIYVGPQYELLFSDATDHK